jgi:hypothetical protein
VVRLFEPILHHQVQVVALVEDLALHIRVILLEKLDLFVLPGHQFLVHRGDLDEETVVEQIEVGGEELDRLAVLEADWEALRFVLPGDPVEIEKKCELTFAVVSELDLVSGRWFVAQGAPTSITPGYCVSSGNNWWIAPST